jgi:flagellar basal body-associated protein FliL
MQNNFAIIKDLKSRNNKMSQLNNNNSDKNNSKIAFILIPILFVLVILGGLGLGLYLIISSFSSLDLEDISTENKEIASENVNVVPDSKAKESLLDKTLAKPEIAKTSSG